MIETSLFSNTFGSLLAPTDYWTTIESGGGTVADKNRSLIVYVEIDSLNLRGEVSLLCTCDAYLANPLLANGTLYTLIPE